MLASSTMQLRSVWVSALLAGDPGTATSTAELWSTRVVRASTAQPRQSPARATSSSFGPSTRYGTLATRVPSPSLANGSGATGTLVPLPPR
jgi:hypothetical protein